MLWHFYVRKQIAYIPVLTKTEAAFRVDCEPVTVVPIDDSTAFRDSLRTVIVKGVPRIPAPTFARNGPKPVVLKYAGVTSWSAFEHGAACYQILLKEGRYHFQPLKSGPQRGWVKDPGATEIFPANCSLEDVVGRIVTRVQEIHTT
jgi:hypothetical protein